MSKNPPQSEQNTNNSSDQEQPYIPPIKAKRKYQPPITGKQREFAKLVATEPITKREAYRKAYGNTTMSDQAVSVEAMRTLRKPLVKLELSKYSDQMKSALVEAVEEAQSRFKDATDRDVAPLLTVVDRVANSIIDRVDGKAVQRVQVQSTAVVISLDLSGATGVEQAKDEQKENK